MDSETFQRLHAATERPLWGYLYASMGSASVADDLSQEAFMRMLTAKFPDAPTESHLRHYLFKIAANLIIDTRRQISKTGEMPVIEPSVPSHEGPILNQDSIDHALSRLRPIDRQLLWLAYVEELPHREIARQLSYKEPSIRPLLHKAKGRMLEVLKRRNP